MLAAAPAIAAVEVAAPAVVESGEPTVAATVDPVLLEILGAEVSGHLVTIDAWLAQAQSHPVAANDGLLRAMHTMNGAFAMTEVPAITNVTGPAETYIRRLLAAHALPTAAGVAALAATADAIRRTVAALQTTAPRVPLLEGLAREVVALRDTLPEAKSPLLPSEPFEEALAAIDLSGYTDLSDAAPADTGLELQEMPAAPVEEALPAADMSEFLDLADAIPADGGLPINATMEQDGASHDHGIEDLVLEDIVLEGGHEEITLEGDTTELMFEAAPGFDDDTFVSEGTIEAIESGEAFDNAAIDAQAALEASLLEAERVEAERIETGRAEVERLEAERLEAQGIGAERLEAERIEAERLEAERVENERAEAERLESARIEAERLEAERVENERAEAERVEAQRAETERLAAEQAEAERLEAERLFQAERAEAERLAAEAAAAEEAAEYARLEAEYEAERQARERAAQEALQSLAPQAEVEAEPEAEHQPEVAQFLADAVASAQDPDEALDLSDLDPELVDIFVEEGGDLLDHSDGLLAALREAPGEREHLVGLQRDLHTLKGGARMAGIMAVGELGHAMESLLEAVVEHRSELGRDGIPLLERGFDRLHAMVTRVGERRAIAMPDALIAEFDARAKGRTYEPEAAPAIARPTPAAPKVELKPLSAPMVDAQAGDDDDVGVRAPQEQVRIRADLLDRLVNYAGEVAIYRSRLEQQLGAFRNAMGEMEATNQRLRDQLRRLDIETEAQIIARYQREHDTADQTFDPLELDRFSTLQQLSRGLAESAADMSSLQGSLEDLTRQYETLLLQQSRVSSELQEGLMRTRMVPFDALVPRLRRVVRQAAADTGKNVQLKLDGAQGELDRNVLERMTAPLEHMLRNAVAHGLESPAERKKHKKSEEGTIRIAVRREGSEVVLEVGDDGAGLNRTAIRKRAEERGLIRSDAVLADADLDALIMEPGFSTADTVSRLAGRGVGMDVVASEVRQLGGALDIKSKQGEGTTFTLRLPQTLAVTQAVFVKIGETTYAVPIASVRGVGRVTREALAKDDTTYTYGGEEYALHDLGLLLGHAPAKAEGQLQMPLLLIRSGELRAAVSIDQVIGNREIVVKPVGPQVGSVPGIFGATIMGDGSVVVILDVAPLVRRQAALPRDTAPTQTVVEARHVPLVMVVDDSVTMRKVTGRVLERHNFEVATAKDGVDALEKLDERVPDLMLLDIEMPRMDGYELATAMKADPRLRNVPIIMITSRTGEKHRQRAFDIGVERYLGKPYQEHELLRNVFELLAQERANG